MGVSLSMFMIYLSLSSPPRIKKKGRSCIREFVIFSNVSCGQTLPYLWLTQMHVELNGPTAHKASVNTSPECRIICGWCGRRVLLVRCVGLNACQVLEHPTLPL